MAEPNSFISSFQSYHAIGWICGLHGPATEEYPKLEYDSSGNRYARYGLKIPTGSTNKPYYYIPLQSWGYKADWITKNIKFGMMVSILGYWEQTRVELSSWNGQPRIRDWFTVIVIDIKILDNRNMEDKKRENIIPWEKPKKQIEKNPDNP